MVCKCSLHIWKDTIDADDGFRADDVFFREGLKKRPEKDARKKMLNHILHAEQHGFVVEESGC